MSHLKLIGKDEVFSSIRTAFLSGLLSHAILIEGDEGMGKTTLAMEICRLLVCGEQNRPCGQCVACKKIDSGIHPDVFEVFPAGKSQTVGVKEIEPLKKYIYVKPNDADVKIVIIHSAERMNHFAQNAMLKMIEEPPEDTFFIFLCKNSQAMLATVLSRVTVYRVTYAAEADVRAELVSRFPELEAAVAERAARISCGNIGLAISLCGENGFELYDDAIRVLKASVNRDRALLCLALGRYSKKKEDALALVSLLKLVFRDVCAKKSGAEGSASGLFNEIEETARQISAGAALKIIEACDEFTTAVLGNANLALCLTAFEIRIGAAVKS